MNKPRPAQQVWTALIVAAGVALTVIGGLALALGEGLPMAGTRPTPTLLRLATVTTTGPQPVITIQAAEGTSTRVPATVTPLRATLRPSATPTLVPSPTPTASATAARQHTPAPPRATRRSPPAPTQGPLLPPLSLGTQSATDGACTHPDSRLTDPPIGARLSGVVTFSGTAAGPDFAFYKLEIRPDAGSTAADFVTFHTGEQPVTGGPLGQLDTTFFANGDHWIRLVVVDSTGNYPERCSGLFVIAN